MRHLGLLAILAAAWSCGDDIAPTADDGVDASDMGADARDLGVLDARAEDSSTVDAVEDMGPAGDVQAALRVLTRVSGVSPETVYFSAEASTCVDCEDIWGLDTPIADAYSELGFHFTFDDADSGAFRTTGRSRNEQVSSSPRAAHTFECMGASDPNWDAGSQRCEFEVGVRVQAKDGDFDDAFISVSIQPQFGPGGYYAAENIYCVSSTSEFAGCPHDERSRHLTDTPAVGNWDQNLVLFHNNGATYSSIFMGVDEQNATADTYGSGARPVIPEVTLASRPGASESAWRRDENIRMLADHQPARDADGNLVDGYGFNQKVVRLRVGRIRNGQSFTLLTLHDLDLDWEASGEYVATITPVHGGFTCRTTDEIDCLPDADSPGIPYPSYFMLTDTRVISSRSNLGFGISCVNGCGLVNSVIQGVEVERTSQHNIRMQGAWGLILSNNWIRGSIVGGSGPKQRITIRPVDSGGGVTQSPDIDKNPEDLSGAGYLRGENARSEFHNRFNVAINNRLNQAVHDPEHASSNLLQIVSYFGTTYGTEYVVQTMGPRPGQGMMVAGRFQTIRNTSWGDEGFWFVDIGGDETYFDGLPYHDTSTICIEGEFTQSRGTFCRNTPPLSLPDAPGAR